MIPFFLAILYPCVLLLLFINCLKYQLANPEKDLRAYWLLWALGMWAAAPGCAVLFFISK